MSNKIDEQDTILIIGAGAAGISAARYLQRQNIPFKIIDASHRVGGRAYSEAYKSGVGLISAVLIYMREKVTLSFQLSTI